MVGEWDSSAGHADDIDMSTMRCTEYAYSDIMASSHMSCLTEDRCQPRKRQKAREKSKSFSTFPSVCLADNVDHELMLLPERETWRAKAGRTMLGTLIPNV